MNIPVLLPHSEYGPVALLILRFTYVKEQRTNETKYDSIWLRCNAVETFSVPSEKPFASFLNTAASESSEVAKICLEGTQPFLRTAQALNETLRYFRNQDIF